MNEILELDEYVDDIDVVALYAPQEARCEEY